VDYIAPFLNMLRGDENKIFEKLDFSCAHATGDTMSYFFGTYFGQIVSAARITTDTAG
jgi:hypothetical protein